MKVTEVYQKHSEENTISSTVKERRSNPILEKAQFHLTCAAENVEGTGKYLTAAEIKQINADICRIQGKERDAYLLDCSISALKKRAKQKR